VTATVIAAGSECQKPAAGSPVRKSAPAGVEDRAQDDAKDGDRRPARQKSPRSEASGYLAAANRNRDPQARALGNAYRGAAEAVENAIEDHRTTIGQPELAQNWDAACTTIAKTYSVENAMDGAGNVDATQLGKRLIKGTPLSGNLEAAANFANAFPKAARNLKESVPGLSPLDVYSGAALDLALPASSVAARPLALGAQPLDLGNITLSQLLGR
jgi:hypothetical protein